MGSFGPSNYDERKPETRTVINKYATPDNQGELAYIIADSAYLYKESIQKALENNELSNNALAGAAKMLSDNIVHRTRDGQLSNEQHTLLHKASDVIKWGLKQFATIKGPLEVEIKRMPENLRNSIATEVWYMQDASTEYDQLILALDEALATKVFSRNHASETLERVIDFTAKYFDAKEKNKLTD